MSNANERTVLIYILFRSQVGIDMRKLIILAALAACCVAAPSAINKDSKEDILQRPSPINPDVPMEPKPAEKITVITDPKEIAKYKRETDHKRDHVEVVPKVLHATETAKNDHEHEHKVASVHRDEHDNLKRDLRKETEKHVHEHEQKNIHEHHAEHAQQKAENEHDHVKHRVKRDSGNSNIKRDNTKVQPLSNKPVQHPATTAKPRATTPRVVPKRSEPARREPVKQEPARREPVKQEPPRREPVKQEPTRREPVRQEPPKHEAVKHRQKRDIATSAASTVNLEHKNDDGVAHVDSVVATTLPLKENNEPHVDAAAATEHKHSAQESQVRTQILPAFLPVGAEVNPHSLLSVIAVKRDIPVPLVPKHHHPEESSRDNDDKKSKESSEENSNEKKHEEHKPNDAPKIHETNKDDVQVEDLSGAVPSQHSKHPVNLEQHFDQLSQNSATHHNGQHSFIHHEQQDQQHHFQPDHPHVASHQAEIAANEKKAALEDSKTTSTEQPVLRHQPVPVAELFARQQHAQQKPTDV